jgi:hypothetical protein
MDDGGGQRELGAVQVWRGKMSFIDMSIRFCRVCTGWYMTQDEVS